MNEFHLYLISKKIEPSSFKQGNKPLFQEFERAFVQSHPASFTAQKLFMLNKLRRKFLYHKPKTT